MEWVAPALVLSAAPYGESGLVVHVLTEAQGACRGLVRGGASRAQAALWQPGNLISARWVARLSEQLGSLSGELVHPSAARLLDHRLNLALLSAACAVADDALPEREPHPLTFAGLLHLLTLLSLDPDQGRALGPAALLRWELVLLSELGYGLDLGSCAISGTGDELAFVSPRSGRAVSAAHAGIWRERLLRLPGFLLSDEAPGEPADWCDGFRLTGHFLARDVFGVRNRPSPAARGRLLEIIERLATPAALTPD